jgi:hypothetical protein
MELQLPEDVRTESVVAVIEDVEEILIVEDEG